METLLLVVTGVSFVAALFLGWTAWRLSREERERAMARVAALAAAVAEPPVTDAPAKMVDDARPAWGTTPRPRSTPRVTTMHAATAQEITWAPPRPEELPLRPEPAATPAMSDGFLGASTARRYDSNGGQRLVAVAAVVLLMALGAAGSWLYSTQPATATAAVASGAPLELISMRHTREGDRLSVSGMVRNPANGQAVDKLSATVLLFDQQNGYLTSTRGSVDVPHLNPGQESPFTLTVQAPVGAARYRVSFRTDDRLVDHVDRRGQAPAAAASVLPGQPSTR